MATAISPQTLLLGAYVVAFLIGSLVGLSEVLSRYRDAPVEAAKTGAGVFYILFNAMASVVALLFVHDIFPLWAASGGANLPPIADKDSLGSLVSQALMAGFGAMAVLRSSVLTTRIGSKDVEIGPAAILNIFRSTMDRSIARVRAESRAISVTQIMGNISFLRSYKSLSSIALTLLQSVDADERADVETQIGALANQTGRTDRDKALELGLILAGSAGFAALKASVNSLGTEIANNKDRPAFVADQVRRLPYESVMRDLPTVCLTLNPDVPQTDTRALSEQIDAVAKSALSDLAKSINVGLLIVATLGEENLKSGIDVLVTKPPVAASPPPVAGEQG